MSYPKTRHEAERDIDSLYGWPEEYGDMADASDDFVIQVAYDQRDTDQACADSGRNVSYTPRIYTWR